MLLLFPYNIAYIIPNHHALSSAGMEIGFYWGCVSMWRQLQKLDPSLIPDRADKGVTALEEMLIEFPLDNPQVGIIA